MLFFDAFAQMPKKEFQSQERITGQLQQGKIPQMPASLHMYLVWNMSTMKIIEVMPVPDIGNFHRFRKSKFAHQQTVEPKLIVLERISKQG